MGRRLARSLRAFGTRSRRCKSDKSPGLCRLSRSKEQIWTFPSQQHQLFLSGRPCPREAGRRGRGVPWGPRCSCAFSGHASRVLSLGIQQPCCEEAQLRREADGRLSGCQLHPSPAWTPPYPLGGKMPQGPRVSRVPRGRHDGAHTTRYPAVRSLSDCQRKMTAANTATLSGANESEPYLFVSSGERRLQDLSH